MPGSPVDGARSPRPTEHSRCPGPSAGSWRLSRAQCLLKDTRLIGRESGCWEAVAACFLIICRSQLPKGYFRSVKVKG